MIRQLQQEPLRHADMRTTINTYTQAMRLLWPAEEHGEGNTIFQVLKDGTRLAVTGSLGSESGS